MSYRITGLNPAPFVPLYGLPDVELTQRGVIRMRVEAPTGYPDRVEVADAPVGSSVLLLNWEHQSADTPFRASHAIFVHEGALQAFDGVDSIPPAMRTRTISLRAFDAAGMMTDADLFEGADLEPGIARMFSDPAVAYLHAHYARRGCYAARVDRA